MVGAAVVTVKATPLLATPLNGYDDIARRRSAWYRNCDARRAPARWSSRGSVEPHRARSLRCSEVRTRNRDRSSYRSGRLTQTCNVRCCNRDGESSRRCSRPPPTVTTTLPVVAPLGTGTVMLVALQLVGVPVVPLKLTVLVPCVAPKFGPGDRDRSSYRSGRLTQTCNVRCGNRDGEATPLLATPPTVTTTLPVVAPVGTGTVMLVALQLVGVPAIPLNFTVLVPCVAPKLVPVIVIEVPTGPDV